MYKRLEPYFYRCHVIRIIDADTVKLEVDRGEGIYTRGTYRLRDVAAPETHRPQSNLEREYGQRAQDWLINQIGHATEYGTLYVQTINRKCSFGRTLGTLFLKVAPTDNAIGGLKNINREMVQMNLVWYWDNPNKHLGQLRPLDMPC